MVKIYRTQFRQILAKDSPDKLIEILRKKVKKVNPPVMKWGKPFF